VLILKFLHIAAMFSGVSVALGAGAISVLIARNGDVRAIRSAFPIFVRLQPLIPAFFGLGVLFGLATAWTAGFDFLRPWLLIAYVLVVAATVIGGGIEGPWQKRVLTAAMTSPDDAPSGELLALTHDRRETFSFWASVVIIAALIFDMVFKPFGL
jgi:hypothetical protein